MTTLYQVITTGRTFKIKAPSSDAARTFVERQTLDEIKEVNPIKESPEPGSNL